MNLIVTHAVSVAVVSFIAVLVDSALSTAAVLDALWRSPLLVFHAAARFITVAVCVPVLRLVRILVALLRRLRAVFVVIIIGKFALLFSVHLAITAIVAFLHAFEFKPSPAVHLYVVWAAFGVVEFFQC